MVPLGDFDSTSCLRVAVIGGGAAGFFAAISTAELNPSAEVVLFESGKKVLRKVKVSGGGRCNVTHSCFEPADLAQKYPWADASSEVLLPLATPRHHRVVRAKGVQTKTEEDGRVFPLSDDSQTIVDCLVGQARKSGVEVRLRRGMTGIEQAEDAKWLIESGDGRKEPFDKVCIAAGSLKSGGLRN